MTPPRSEDDVMAALAFDPSTVLARESSSLIEPHFLASLHRELELKHGAAETAATLLQIGFLHGLRDARAVVDGISVAQPNASSAVEYLQLAIQFQNRPPAPGLEAAIELWGRWPDAAEAIAHGTGTKGAGGVCFMSAGYTSGWFSGIHDVDMLVMETTCCVRDGEACSFIAREVEAWRAVGPEEFGDDWERVRFMLESIPFAWFRNIVAKEADPFPGEERLENAFDPDSAVIHIWGPVMVLPYSGTQEALHAVRLIGNDPSAQDVSVVILDLTGTRIDDALGAMSLAPIVKAIEAWGAEAVFAGLGNHSRRMITNLSSPPIAIHRDVEQAIVAGFQIATAQRRTA